MADIGSYILAGSQGLAGGINKLGEQMRDAEAKAEFERNWAKLYGQMNPIPPAQLAVPNTLAGLSQPVPQPIAQQNPGNATTAQLPPISPSNRPVAQGFANEMGQKWAQQPGQIGGNVPALAGLSAPLYSQQSAPAPQRQAAPSQAMAYAGGGVDASGRAISGIESGGRYDALGPLTKGDRAYGKYQVMGANIPAWTQAYVGRAMTPQEFVASPEAQEAVFRGEFGRLSQKYGPEGAARAWFAGEGGMNDRNRRDVLGTSVADYSSKFVAGGGAGQGQTNPLASVTPMGGSPAPQQPQTLAQLSMPPQQQFDMGTLGALMTNKYGAPLAQAILAKQLGRDPIEQQMNLLKLQQVQNEIAFSPEKSRLAIESAQLANRKAQAELSGESTATTPDMKEFALAKRQGFQGTFLDYQQAKSAAKQKPGLSAADQKVIFAEEDQLPAIDNTIETLKRAKELNNKTYTGLTAGIRGSIMSGVGIGGEDAKATREFGQIMSMEAIKSMSSLLKGATTDKEMMEFQRLLSDPTTPPDIRERTINRMLTLAERQKQIATGRINELRSKAGQPPIGSQRPQGPVSDPLGIR